MSTKCGEESYCSLILLRFFIIYLGRLKVLLCDSDLLIRCEYEIWREGLLQFSVAGVGWLSWSVAKSLRAFVESVFANSRVKNVVFTIPAKQAIYSCQYTGAVIG